MADEIPGRSYEAAAGREMTETGSRDRETAGETARPAREAADEARSWARSQAREVRDRSREKARDLRLRAEERTDRWTTTLGHEVESIAHAARNAGETFEEEGKPRLAAWSRIGADRAERLARYLDQKDPRTMVDDLENLARANTAVFTGATLAAGVLLGRFLRSSAPEKADGERRPSLEPNAEPPVSTTSSTRRKEDTP